MKKYKLISEYPNSPKLGTIISRRAVGEDYWSYDDSTVVLLRKDSPENYPDFWQEVKSNYKTVSWIDKKGNVHENEEPVGTILGDGELHITSITRESDNESFSLGDVVTLDNRLYKITKFKEIPEVSTVVVDGKSLKAGRSFHNYSLGRIERANSILKTKDGRDLFGGETIYHVCSLDNSYNLYETVARVEISNPPCYFHYFAEKENAEKFISNNKKMYTLKDMVKIANHWAYVKSVTPEVAQKVIDKWTN